MEFNLSELLAKKLTGLIQQSGMSKSEIARQLGMARQTVQGWTTRGKISKEKLKELCELLGVAINVVLDEPDLDQEQQNTKERLKKIIDQIPSHRTDILRAIEIILTK